jgi:hypothetical protein
LRRSAPPPAGLSEVEHAAAIRVEASAIRRGEVEIISQGVPKRLLDDNWLFLWRLEAEAGLAGWGFCVRVDAKL